MKNSRDNDFADRRATAAEAKTALLRSYRAANEAVDPARLARQEERKVAAVAREERQAKRERLKLDEQNRAQALSAERQAAADAAAKVDAEERERAEKDRMSRLVEEEAAQKAARDLRYANRKARQR